MARTDGVLTPYSVSDIIKQNVVASEDHLRTVCDQLTEAGLLHVFSPFTLIRGSFEAVTQGLYVLGQRSTRGMQRRVLQIEHSDLFHVRNFASQLQIPDPIGSDCSDVEGVEAVAHRLGFASKEIKGAPTYSNLLNIVENEYPGASEFPAYWRLCSGVAHSKPWAMKFVTKVHGSSADRQFGEPTVQVEIDRIWLARTLHAACRYHEMLRLTFLAQASGEEDHRASLFKRSMEALIVNDPMFATRENEA